MAEKDIVRREKKIKPSSIRVVKKEHVAVYREMGNAFYGRKLGDHRVTVPLVLDYTSRAMEEAGWRSVIMSDEKRNRKDFETAIERAVFFMDTMGKRPSLTEEQVQSSVRQYVYAVANGVRDRIFNTPNYQRVRDTSHHY